MVLLKGPTHCITDGNSVLHPQSQEQAACNFEPCFFSPGKVTRGHLPGGGSPQAPFQGPWPTAPPETWPRLDGLQTPNTFETNHKKPSANKGPYSQSYGFPSSHVRTWQLDCKKAEWHSIDAFELWCWRRLLRVPWTAMRSNQSILQEINPE